MLTLASRGPTDLLNIDFNRLRFHYRGPRRQTELQTLRLLAAGGRPPHRLQAHRRDLGLAPGLRFPWLPFPKDRPDAESRIARGTSDEKTPVRAVARTG